MPFEERCRTTMPERGQRNDFEQGLRWLERASGMRSATSRSLWPTTFLIANTTGVAEVGRSGSNDTAQLDLATYPALARFMRLV